jgi:uncharacterized protein (TIGR02996 family)
MKKILARASALATTDPEAALASLLEAWRSRRAPELAALVKRMSAAASKGREPITAQTRVELHRAWLAVEKKKDPADLDRLIDAVVKGQCADAQQRIDRLAKWPDDPRLRDALVDAVCARVTTLRVPLAVQPPLREAAPFTSKPNRPFWGRGMMPLLERLGDASVVPRLRAVPREGSEFERWLGARVQKLLPILEARPVPSLGAEELAAANGVAKALERSEAVVASAGRELDALYAAVWARPDDDEPRQVLADFLSERGDPRGEFINLQMARHRNEITSDGKRREKELLKLHKKDWLGPISRFIQAYYLRFERGFLVTCQLEHGTEKMTRAELEHPAWSTIREFRIHYFRKDAKILFVLLESYGANHVDGTFTRGIE